MPYMQLSSIRMHYFERGNRETASERIVFTHGLRRSARSWQLVQQALPEYYYSISANNRGSGETDAPASEDDYGVRHFASDLFELVTALDLQQFTLIGISDGGPTAMQFAVDHPHLVKALVLLDPTDPDGNLPDGMEVEAFVNKRVASWRRLCQAIRTGEETVIPLSAPAEFREALLNDIVSAPERRIRGSIRAMALLRIGHLVKTLPMPILLMSGDSVSIERLLTVRAKLPEGTYLQILHGVGHALPSDLPGETTATIQRFIEQTVPNHLGKSALTGR